MTKTRATKLRALTPSILDLYWSAQTRQQERTAYLLLRALGFPPSYGEHP